jgi:hypothetical protein
MDFPQFSWRERRDAVLRHEDAQLVLRVDAPRLGAGFLQRGLGGLVLAEKQHLLDRLGVHHNEGQPEQGEKTRFVSPQRINEV